MKYFIIVLRDIKADTHKPPMFVNNINAAIRDLTDMVNDANGKEEWQRHPEDFELWHSGEWDAETNTFYTPGTGNVQDKQLLALSTLKA